MMHDQAPDKFTKTPCHYCKRVGGKPNPAWMRYQREAAGMSLREMATFAGITPSYVSQLETGKRGCSRRVLASYERVAEVTKETADDAVQKS